MDYALYLRGLVLFNEDQSFLNKLASQDWSDRDPKANREAYQAFAELVQRFPNSKYAADATARMVKLVDALGGNEMSVARYYMKRGAYIAAANRAQKSSAATRIRVMSKNRSPYWNLPTKNSANHSLPPIRAACWKPTSRKARF